MDLTESQAVAMTALALEDLRLASDWEAAGHRRQRFFFTNSERAIRVRLADITALGGRGLIELIDDPEDGDALIAKITSRGLSLMNASDIQPPKRTPDK